MFKINFLPARFGDAIWIEYGDEDQPHRLLIDGGTAGTRNDIKSILGLLPPERRHFDLIVISHIDRDHIEGILGLLGQDELGFEVDDIWFNGWPHLPGNPEDEEFGAVQGERLTACILDHGLRWNDAFNKKAIFIPEDGALPERHLPGGLKLTLLSPTFKTLQKLKPVWEKEVRENNLDPGFGLAGNDTGPAGGEDEEFGGEDLPDVDALAEVESDEDRSEANGSSIALLAEFDHKRVLLTADAHSHILASALERFSPGERVSLELFKLSHHGSKFCTSRSLIEKVDCPKYIFSTNGSIFKHPDHETIARVIKAGGDQPELIFNYRGARNEIWDLPFLKNKHGYTTRYPEGQTQGIEIIL